MDEGCQKDLQLLEEIIDKCLKQKLLQTIAYTVLASLFSFYAIHCGLCCICWFCRDNIFEEQKELKVTVHSHLVESHCAFSSSRNSELRKNLETFEKNGVQPRFRSLHASWSARYEAYIHGCRARLLCGVYPVRKVNGVKFLVGSIYEAHHQIQ
uniref:Uncharacterized protein n=1 Tax=Brassica oleracea TaxID=3712 RepID=A0A3P6EUW4_BRAOL|nr:unnamed protein product [Brassica oleracea]